MPYLLLSIVLFLSIELHSAPEVQPQLVRYAQQEIVSTSTFVMLLLVVISRFVCEFINTCPAERK